MNKIQQGTNHAYRYPLNPACYLRDHAVMYPKKHALTYPDKEHQGEISYGAMTFQDLDQRSDLEAYALYNQGFRRGDTVVFMVKPGPELFTMLFAMFKIGAVPVVVDPGMGLKRMLHCYSRVRAQRFLGVLPATVLRVMAFPLFSTIRSTVTVLGGSIVGQSKLLETVDHEQPFPLAEPNPDETALICFTTGSTGPAKAVEINYQMVQSMFVSIVEHSQIETDDIQLLTLPLFGFFGLMQGNRCVLPKMDPAMPAKANPKTIIQAIHQFKVTSLFASPALLNRLGAYGDYLKTRNKEKSNEKNGAVTPIGNPVSGQLASLRLVSCGGAPITLATMQSVTALLPEHAVFETTWGATEGLPITSMPIDGLLDETYDGLIRGEGLCLGRPVGKMRVKAITITDAAISHWTPNLVKPEKCVGELIIQGENVSDRYYQDEPSNRQNKIRMGDKIWHRTGDLGRIDAQGRIWFYGRKSQRVVLDKPDQTLYTVSIEGIINAHTEVYRSALVSVTDRDGGVSAVIVVELKQSGFNPVSNHRHQVRIRQELFALMMQHDVSKPVQQVLFHRSLPVDIRHNAKIDRQLLGRWAQRKLTARGVI